jgi:NDP-sugar pyrophosphorylase family protein
VTDPVIDLVTDLAARSSIRGGIIAAGQGTRLRADGYRVSKPMVPIAGRPLIDLTLDRFRLAGIRRLTVIINDTSDDCRQWLRDHAGGLDLDLIVRTTPSSYASFQTVAGRLVGAPAVITTVDAVMPADDFCGFVETAADLADNAVALGLTAHVDDESPLWATLDADGRIRQLGGSHGTHVTAGLYWLPVRRPAEPTTGFERLRDYLGWLVAEHQPVCGIVLPRVFDIDRACDVAAAEAAHYRGEDGKMDGA